MWCEVKSRVELPCPWHPEASAHPNAAPNLEKKADWVTAAASATALKRGGWLARHMTRP